MSSIRSDHKVLIVAADPLLSALIGILVEAERLQAAFPAAEESIDDAVSRVRPLAAILVDVVAEAAASDVFLARARRADVPVLVFGSGADVAALRDWAAQRDVPLFALPRDTNELRAALHRLAQRMPRRTGGRRAVPRLSVERDGEGHLVFADDNGARWTIYDRRTGERRGAKIERDFVNASGEVRRCVLTAAEARSTKVGDLTRQLAEAVLAG